MTIRQNPEILERLRLDSFQIARIYHSLKHHPNERLQEISDKAQQLIPEKIEAVFDIAEKLSKGGKFCRKIGKEQHKMQKNEKLVRLALAEYFMDKTFFKYIEKRLSLFDARYLYNTEKSINPAGYKTPV